MPWVSEVLAVLSVIAAAWVAGVGFAVYRAVGWVEAMRGWAFSLGPVECEPDVVCIAGSEVETGWE